MYKYVLIFIIKRSVAWPLSSVVTFGVAAYRQMESLCPAVFDGDIWIFGQDFKASAQLSGVQDLSAMELLLVTLLGGRVKAAYESVRRNTDECSTGSGKQFPKWEGPHMVTSRWDHADTIAMTNNERRVNVSELQKWIQRDKPTMTPAPSRSSRLQSHVFDGGTSVVRAGREKI
uniref:Uncharacterized protein n=1 Tax=Trichobilharzia regenti TaxID=157069 RepID=A0AA85JVJ9_TRIRE|nr:unnamed protein product [Trichobilharzia regenti]